MAAATIGRILTVAAIATRDIDRTGTLHVPLNCLNDHAAAGPTATHKIATAGRAALPRFAGCTDQAIDLQVLPPTRRLSAPPPAAGRTRHRVPKLLPAVPP